MHDVLHDVCAFSTVKQVDAAAEEVDKLQGGKQAAALKNAEAAGAGPSAAAGAAAAAAAQAGGPHPAPPSAAPGAPGQHAPAAAGAAPAPPLGHIQSGKYTLPSSGNKTADKVAAGLLTAGAAVASAVRHPRWLRPLLVLPSGIGRSSWHVLLGLAVTQCSWPVLLLPSRRWAQPPQLRQVPSRTTHRSS